MMLNVRNRDLRIAAAVVAIIFLLNGCIYFWASSFRTWTGSMRDRPDAVAVLAVLYGQFAILLAWACLTRAAILLRIVSVPLAFWFSRFMVLRLGRDTTEGVTFRLLALAASTSILFIIGRTLILGIERKQNNMPDPTILSDRHEFQFSLKDMLVFTVVAATIFAIMRLRWEATWAAPLGVIAFASAWAVLGIQYVWTRLVALAVVTVLIGLGLHGAFWRGVYAPELLSDLLFIATFALVLVFGFVGFRLSGYRLHRRPRRARAVAQAA